MVVCWFESAAAVVVVVAVAEMCQQRSQNV